MSGTFCRRTGCELLVIACDTMQHLSSLVIKKAMKAGTSLLLTGFANRQRPWGDCAYPHALCTANPTRSTASYACAYTPTQVCARGSDGKSLATSASDTRTRMHTRTRTRRDTNAHALAHTHTHTHTHTCAGFLKYQDFVLESVEKLFSIFLSVF